MALYETLFSMMDLQVAQVLHSLLTASQRAMTGLLCWCMMAATAPSPAAAYSYEQRIVGGDAAS